MELFRRGWGGSRRGGSGAEKGGDPWVAHGGGVRCDRETGRRATQGSLYLSPGQDPLHPCRPRPYETKPLPCSFHKYLPLKAGVVWMWGILSPGQEGAPGNRTRTTRKRPHPYGKMVFLPP